jgi:hypothetical protein
MNRIYPHLAVRIGDGTYSRGSSKYDGTPIGKTFFGKTIGDSIEITLPMREDLNEGIKREIDHLFKNRALIPEFYEVLEEQVHEKKRVVKFQPLMRLDDVEELPFILEESKLFAGEELK